ncbi:MAG: PAS domain-containing protein [Candidatus Acidiferrales bacterium]
MADQNPLEFEFSTSRSPDERDTSPSTIYSVGSPDESPRDLLQSIVQSRDDFVFVLNPEGMVHAVSCSNDSILPRPLDELLKLPLEALFGKELLHQIRKEALHALATGRGQDIEHSFELADGKHTILVRVMPLAHAGATKVCLLARDITEQKSTDEKLRNTLALLEQAVELADIGSWEYSVESRSFVWSDHFFRMLGLKPESEVISLERSCQHIHPEDRARLWKDVAALISEGRPLENEFRFVRANLQVCIFHSRAVPIVDAAGRVTSIRGMSQDITEHKAFEKSLQELTRRVLNLRDEERRRVARDLHETVVQSLAALQMSLSRLREALPGEKTLAHALEESSTLLAEDAIREVRTMAYLMHPPTLDLAGLDSALRWFAAGFTERSGISVTVEVSEEFGRLSQEIETTIFRIVQEALTNVHRHSGSRTAAIRLTREPGSARFEIQDYGRGMPSPESRAGTHSNASFGVGIAGMRERMKQLDGRLEIRSEPGGGTTILGTLPIGQPISPGG